MTSKHWTLVTILLVAIIAISGIIACSRYSLGQPIEITKSLTQELSGEIYIAGAVGNPGFYPLKADDTIEALIQAAGGTTSNADPDWLELYLPGIGEKELLQKVDLNRAEAWLLEALPEIGKALAQAIIDYRQQNGPFCNINKLINVEGIGTATYEKIKLLITVAD